jgi:hypothetical protein
MVERRKVNVPAALLKVGDVIEVWWKPGLDTIVDLQPYLGPLECLRGGRLATFAQLRSGMTIEPGSMYRRVEVERC